MRAGGISYCAVDRELGQIFFPPGPPPYTWDKCREDSDFAAMVEMKNRQGFHFVVNGTLTLSEGEPVRDVTEEVYQELLQNRRETHF